MHRAIVEDMTGHDRTPDDRWLTYIEAGELLSISPEAVRAIARRQKWPRQTANAVGRAVRILVPADRISPVTANGQIAARPVTANGHTESAPELHPDVTGHAPSDMTGHQRIEELLSTIKEMAATFMEPLREQLERAEIRVQAAESRAQEAEKQVRDLQERLTAEMTEHRRIIGLLTEQLAVRRSWWPWRR
jgi:hypothetical protein